MVFILLFQVKVVLAYFTWLFLSHALTFFGVHFFHFFLL